MESLFVIVIFLLMCYGIYVMAENRGRNAWGWAICSALLSPLLGFLALLILGKTEEQSDKDFMSQVDRNKEKGNI